MQAANIYRLGVKELWSLLRDPIMLVLIVYAFTLAIYTASTAAPETLSKVPVAIVDEDHSQLSGRIGSALLPPYFIAPDFIATDQMDAGLDAGRYTFTLNIPPNFQRDVLAGRQPAIQLNVDATRMSQAFSGSGYLAQIVQTEVANFVQGHQGSTTLPVRIEQRMRFNPTLTQSWTLGVMEIINIVTMLSIILTGAALIREREHGTIEHLLVMPVTPAVQGLVDGDGGTDCHGAVDHLRGAGLAGGADRGIGALVPAGDPAAPVFHHLAGHFPGHAGAHHAAVRPADAAGDDAAANAVGGRQPA